MSIPASTALTQSQSDFVDNLIITGDPKTAYLASFATSNPGAAQVNASKLLKMPKIRQALRERSDNRITSFIPTALKTLTDIASNPSHKDASANAKHVLALAGYQPHQVIEVHKIDTASKIKAITAMVSTLKGMGMVIDLQALIPQGLLSISAPTIDEDDEFIGA